MKIKESLKKYKLFLHINAEIKAILMENSLKSIIISMEQLPTEYLCCTIKKSVTKILWIGGSYHQDHSGFMQSLKKIGIVEFFTKTDSSYGLTSPSTEALISDQLRTIHETRINYLIERNAPDIVLGQMWASTISPELLNKIRDKGITVINIAMDDKLPYHWQTDRNGRRNGAIGLAEGVDLTLNTTKIAAEWYNKLGFPCLYWPLAGNPEVFYPRPVKKYDVVFIGSKYGYRGELVESLIKAGVNVAAFGPGWPAGPCSAEDSAEIFGSAKIILGIGYIGHSKKIVTLKQRDFDALFTGALYITSRNPDLEEMLIDRQHIVYYDNKKDMIEKVKYYLSHDEERETIIRNAMQEGLAKHTWDIRLSETFRKIGIITPSVLEST